LPNDLHEARVREFLATAQLADPERYAAVCAKYPVKSKRQLRSIAEVEITAGLQPVKLRRLPKPLNRRHHASDEHSGGPAERRYEQVLDQPA
jgi:hypothetical protein